MSHDPLFDHLESAGSAKSARSAGSAVAADPRSPLNRPMKRSREEMYKSTASGMSMKPQLSTVQS